MIDRTFRYSLISSMLSYFYDYLVAKRSTIHLIAIPLFNLFFYTAGIVMLVSSDKYVKIYLGKLQAAFHDILYTYRLCYLLKKLIYLREV